MGPLQSKLLPARIVDRVCWLYHSMDGNVLTVNENPIAKIPLSVHGYDGNLHVTPLVVEEDDNENEDGSPLTEEQQLQRQNRKYECDLKK